MHPVLFKIGSITLYTYGFMIAVGIVFGVTYLTRRGRKELRITFDQVNNLFLLVFLAAVIGGKVFLFFESPRYYAESPGRLFAGSGFVFYGSFLFAIPTMLWFFRKNKLPVYQMLDIMAIVTCLVHMFGRVGCFMAGCCYGKPTEGFLAVIFTDPACQAKPLNTPLFPSQLMEAGFILLVMLGLLYLRDRKQFHGQLFLVYIVAYAAGRFVLEYFRGDEVRGFIIDPWLSHSQFIALLIAFGALYFYPRWKKLQSITSNRSQPSRP
ncbi:MAG: prolipoprotein diacylglyceryl transferase [Cyclobacteriaceae bacterium]|jgi:phosphatidylglycerol:prolipoprotein diacylglycerol transferase|nr:prolipoprotein diacylglyceryl transferase [Cyclobacteriaceae bacterium]